MKVVILNTMLVMLCITASAQNKPNYWAADTENSFNEAHCPFTDAISMWVMQQNLTIHAFQTSIRSEFGLNGMDLSKADNDVEVYIPLVEKERFSALCGTGFSREIILAEIDSLDKSLAGYSQFWFPLQYRLNKLRFTVLYEYFLRGDSETLFEKTGNGQRLFSMTTYAINLKWQLTFFLVYMEDYQVNKKNAVFAPALQLRYTPTKNLLIAAGAPVLLGIEWSINPKIDLFFSQVMLSETKGFIRYKITDKLGLSLHYNLIKTGLDAYFNNESVVISNQTYNYNNVIQNQSSISMKLGINPLEDIGIIFCGGYKIGHQVDLYDNDTKVSDSNGQSEFFAGFTFQYLKYF